MFPWEEQRAHLPGFPCTLELLEVRGEASSELSAPPLLLITEVKKIKNSPVPPTVDDDCTFAAYCSAVPSAAAQLATAAFAGFSDGALGAWELVFGSV